MIVKLIALKDGKPSQAFRVRSEETIIGRRQGCDVRIPSEAVSRRHCLVRVHNGAVMVEDLASVNGTFVNGKRIATKQLLYPGDRLEVGPVTFVVQYARPEVPTQSPLPVEAEDDVPELELIEDEEAPLKFGDEAPADEKAPGQDVIEAIDEAGGLQLPESEQLRDILAQMDDKPKKDKKPQR